MGLAAVLLAACNQPAQETSDQTETLTGAVMTKADQETLTPQQIQMMQQQQPDDYVLATGDSRSVREFVETAFRTAEVDIAWQGDGVDEIGICRETGKLIPKERLRAVPHATLSIDAKNQGAK